jgi:hypothetical protein
VFVSTGKNGTGTARDLFLHTYNSQDIVFVAGNNEKARVLASGGGIRLPETTSPAIPPADKVVLYARDNGSGKTQLVALFSSGSAQVIATQP